MRFLRFGFLAAAIVLGVPGWATSGPDGGSGNATDDANVNSRYTVESIDVAASPAAVWDSIVHMGPIPDAPAAPFRWGLAYPLRGEIHGAGIGAIRVGVFSTGVAYERVTEWAPGRKLSFIVLSDPPSMHELSPYAHVNAPHVRGYFRTRDARFTITPLANGRTRLTLATHHDLDLEPALYWLPMAQWAVHANKVRVLRHFRDQAERHP